MDDFTIPSVQWKSHYVGTKVHVDRNAVERKVTYRAVAVATDQRRPNKVKPLYKRKRFVTEKPLAYMVKGMGLIIHPDLYAKVQAEMAKDIKKRSDEMIASLFGFSA